MQAYINEAIRSIVVYYEKEPENLEDQTLEGFYKASYVSFENALWDFQIEMDMEEGSETPQETAESQETSFEWYYPKKKKRSPQKPQRAQENVEDDDRNPDGYWGNRLF